MLVGIDPLIKGLCALEYSKFDFHLTGSRFFGTQTENSDFDFFVEYSTQVEEYLKENNFFGYNSGYEDTETMMVYNYQVGDTRIDVQLVKNASTKAMIQEVLKSHPLVVQMMSRGMKDDRTAMWNLMYDLAKTTTLCSLGEKPKRR